MEARHQAKHQNENNESEQNKIRRLKIATEPASTALKITDLNDFCLIKIFEHLDIQSLLNVSNANKWLQPATVNAYRKFGKIPVHIIRFSEGIFSRSCVELSKWNERIEIFGLKTALQYLRCFGQSVADLTIDYGYSQSKQYDYVQKYINKYCATSLNRIKFMRMPNIKIKHFQKVFANVRDLQVSSSNFGQQLKTLVKCFPNVCCFDVSYSEIIDRFVEKPFPYLEHLSLWDVRCDKFTSSEIVADLLNGIHQLKSLDVKFINDSGRQMPISILLDLIKDNPSITKLICPWSYKKSVNLAEVKRIVAEHSTLIQLVLFGYQFTADNTIALIRQLNSLKRFKFLMLHSEYRHLVLQSNDSEWELDDDLWPRNDVHYRITLNRKM